LSHNVHFALVLLSFVAAFIMIPIDGPY
jgi:hypothetical protein